MQKRFWTWSFCWSLSSVARFYSLSFHTQRSHQCALLVPLLPLLVKQPHPLLYLSTCHDNIFCRCIWYRNNSRIYGKYSTALSIYFLEHKTDSCGSYQSPPKQIFPVYLPYFWLPPKYPRPTSYCIHILSDSDNIPPQPSIIRTCDASGTSSCSRIPTNIARIGVSSW